MTRLEMVREALSELGEASAAEITTCVERRHGVKISPTMIPVLRASLRELDMLHRFRAESKALAEQMAKATQPAASPAA